MVLLINNDERRVFSINHQRYKIEPGQRQQFPFTITQQENAETKQVMHENKKAITIDIMSIKNDEVLGSIETSFIAPHQ